MKDLIGKKVIKIIELNVNENCKIFGKILSEKKYKTGNKSVTLEVEGNVLNATENSVEIYQNKSTEMGIDSYGWFEKNKFERTFKVVE